MPTYQYACTECGHQLEAVQSFSDAALTECPDCHGKLRKVFNSVGIVFKGTGFYRNDSRADKVSAEKAESSGGKTDAPKADAPKSDAPKSDGAKSDALCAIFLTRCDEFLKNPPPAEWDGVWRMTSK